MTEMLELWFRFVLAVLATWRVTHLLANEDGPADIIFRIRQRFGSGFFGKLADCFQCLSLWVAIPIAFFVGRATLEWCVSWLALSGAACLLERTGREDSQPVLLQKLNASEEVTNHAVLRSESRNVEK
jgi:hypothetical protein